MVTVRQRLSRLARPLRRLNPRWRRWEGFLHSLPLDPDALPRPLPSPGARDFIICGSPRSGTTLAAAMLWQPPRCVTVMEPWDGMRLAPAALFGAIRREIADTGGLSRGKLDVPALLAEGAVRWWREGQQPLEVATEPDYLLGVKWPGYWRFLELLPETKFVLCLRHPVETIASFKTSGERLSQGLNYDTAFNRSMNEHLLRTTRDEALRRVLLFDYIAARILPCLGRPNVFLLRYERWFSEREALMRELSAFLGAELGMGAPILRPSRSTAALTAEELALIRAYCTTASALGYDLDGSAPRAAVRAGGAA